MAYLSKILIAALQEFAEKGILRSSIKPGHLITLRDRGYITIGETEVGGPGYVLSEKGRAFLDSLH